jgi:tetratricopeptide (TPR) repeat protein
MKYIKAANNAFGVKALRMTIWNYAAMSFSVRSDWEQAIKCYKKAIALAHVGQV